MTTTITISPLVNETRLRDTHSTAGKVISLHNIGVIVSGDEVWTARVNTTDGTNTKAGDKWLLVKSINGVPTTGWIAIIHNGIALCKTVKTTITPLANETRLRDIHSTKGKIVNVHSIGAVVAGYEVWTADVNTTDGTNTKAGDKWLLVKSVNGVPETGWMAIIHNGAVICKVIEPVIPPVEPPTPPVEPPVEPPANSSDDVVKILYSDVLCVMGDGSQKTFRLTPLP